MKIKKHKQTPSSAFDWWNNLSNEDRLKYANDYYSTDDVNSLNLKQIVQLSSYILKEKTK